jgi:hypothetical protein
MLMVKEISTLKKGAGSVLSRMLMDDGGKGLARTYRFTMFLLIETEGLSFSKRGEVTYVAGQWVTVPENFLDWT